MSFQIEISAYSIHPSYPLLRLVVFSLYDVGFGAWSSPWGHGPQCWLISRDRFLFLERSEMEHSPYAVWWLPFIWARNPAVSVAISRDQSGPRLPSLPALQACGRYHTRGIFHAQFASHLLNHWNGLSSSLWSIRGIRGGSIKNNGLLATGLPLSPIPHQLHCCSKFTPLILLVTCGTKHWKRKGIAVLLWQWSSSQHYWQMAILFKWYHAFNEKHHFVINHSQFHHHCPSCARPS